MKITPHSQKWTEQPANVHQMIEFDGQTENDYLVDLFTHAYYPSNANLRVEAEYEALLALLRLALTHDMAHLTLCGDSQLVVKQVLGEWACQSASLRPLSIEARRLMRELLARGTVKLSWIPREQNTEADVLSVRALGVIRETPEQTAQWVTQTQIGKALAISAVAVGKKLDALGYRANKRPTAVALEHGLARIKEDHFGQHISWHLTKTVHTLQGEGER